MAISIFSVIDELTVDSDDIIEAETFVEQYLSAQFPTYDFRKGTALRDMTVRPNATLLALVNKAIKAYFDDTDIINITDDTDDDIVDSRLSNFFITRKSGDSSVIMARLYFSFPTTTTIATIIPTSATFSLDNEFFFSLSEAISVNPDPGTALQEDGEYYYSYDGSEDLHYVDVELTAEGTSDDYNISEGDLLYFTIFSPYFLQAEVLYQVSAAVDTETNSEMVERAYSSISTRNLINEPSIESGISDQFNYAGEIFTAGLGSDYLYRDLINITQSHEDSEDTLELYHRGGHVDIYVDTGTVTQSLQFTLDEDGRFYIEGPVLSMRRADEAQSGKADDTVDAGADYLYYGSNVSRYTDGVPETYSLDVGLSASQITTCEVPYATEGLTITMDIVTVSGLSSIQTAITSDDQRVVCADYLTRAFEPVYINVDIDVREGTDYDAAIEAVGDYIESISAGGELTVSNIVSAVQNAGITNFVMPITVEAVSKNRYIEYDTSDLSVTDDYTESVIDLMNLRPTQMFKIGTITLTEV